LVAAAHAITTGGAKPSLGSGISVLIPEFNKLRDRARVLLSTDPALMETIEGVEPIQDIDERSHRIVHITANRKSSFAPTSFCNL
jgi:hypothetical protein